MKEQTGGPIPVFDTKETFLSFVEPLIDPDISVVAINFAYHIFPRFDRGWLDGVLVSGAKEHRFEGLVGERVGYAIEQHLKNRRQVKVVLANDTICLLLSGLATCQKNELAAGVVGSGVNFAIFLGDTAAVNLESANFNTFMQSEEARTIDQISVNPGRALFEKETSGVYLYQLYNARTNGHVRSTEELHALARKGDVVAQEFFTRSAQLVSCQVAGITQFYGHDTTFVMEGSVFWKGWNYQEQVAKTVKQLVPEYQISFVKIPDSDIFGASHLVI